MENEKKTNIIFASRFDGLIKEVAPKKDGTANYELFTRKYNEFSGEQKTSQWIRNMVKGKQKITVDTANILGDMLNIDPEYLYIESVQYKTPSEKFIKEMNSQAETDICFDRLLKAMGYKIIEKETEDILSTDRTVIDTLTFKHNLNEKEYEDIKKEILDFINFKFERL